MSKICGLAVVVVSLTVGASPLAQEFDIASFTLCELVNSRGRLSGRMVVVRAEVIDVRNAVVADPSDHGCGLAVMAHPDDPRVTPKPAFSRVEDDNYAQLRKGFGVLTPKPPRTKGRVIATLEGRFDSIYAPGRRERGGFGHQGLYKSRLVVRRVFDVEVMPGQARPERQPSS